MDEREFLKPESVYAIEAWSFPIRYLFKYCFEWLEEYLHLGAFYEYLQLFYPVYPCSFFVMISPFPNFASLVSGCWYAIAHSPPTYWYNFLSLFWNVLSWMYCLVPSQYLFSLSSFTKAFLFITSNCVAFLFLFEHILMFFFCLSIFA